MSQDPYARHRDLISYLLTSGANYRVIAHQPCRTSEESAAARAAQGEPDAVGAKALVVKLQRDDTYALLVMPGTKKMDNKAARQSLGLFRFANQDELPAVTHGLVPGSVPPFGWPYLPGVKRVYLDPEIVAAPKVGFNAAALDRSLVMTSAEYLRVLGDYEDLYPCQGNSSVARHIPSHDQPMHIK